MYIQGTLLQHGDSLKNAYKDKISQTKFQRETYIYIQWFIETKCKIAI